MISPNHDPLIIFWHASRQTTSNTQPDVRPINPPFSSSNEMSGDRRIKKPVKQQLNQQGTTDNFPLQQPVKNKPKQSNVWSRLGPEKKDADDNWAPDKAGDGEQQDEYVDEGVFEGPNFLQELGNKLLRHF